MSESPSAPELLPLLRANKLEDAIQYLNGCVRGHPTSIELRVQLAELLCVAGNLERADTVLDAVGAMDPAAMPGVALFRQLIRAEQARQQFYAEGRVPDFLIEPDVVMTLELRAAVALREGALGEIAALLAERDAARAVRPGVADGAPFADFRDLDDLAAAHLEVLTSTGKYFWIGMENLRSITFRKPGMRRDLLWRRALLSVIDGSDGEVFVPSIYADREILAEHRLGHATDFWQPIERVHLGRGLRTFLGNDGGRTILELGSVVFS